MSHPTDSHDVSIPILSDVLVPGDSAQARSGPASVGLVPGEAEFASGSTAERYVPPAAPAAPAAPLAQPAATAAAPASAQRTPDYDADLLAERLRGRFASYLTGEGRGLIEARCRDAFQDHTTWLVNQITREVALALEVELSGWVREAIREELKQRPHDGA